MDRRKFFVVGISGTVAISVPSLLCNTGDDVEHAAFLEAAAGRKHVVNIGKLYTEKYPDEATTQKLKDLIHSALTHEKSASIRQVIEKDFNEGNVVVVNGWILSRTEARQAALSFLNS